MKKCTKCGKTYDDSFKFCSDCGIELVEENQEEKEVEVEEKSATDENVEFCVYCGGIINAEKGYCIKCGKSARVEGERHCIKCGAVLNENQKFCAKCGTKVSKIVAPRAVDNVKEKAKKIKPKKVIAIVIAVLAVIVLAVGGKNVASKVFVSTEEILNEGDYEKAYKKAKKSEKESILVENLMVTLCAEAKENLKNEDSFKLREAYFDKDTHRIVLRIQGTNTYGGEVNSYWFYTFSEKDNKYSCVTSISDFEEEEINSWDDADDELEKIIDNAARKRIKEIINDNSNRLSDGVVKRINNLNKKGKIKEIKLLDDAKSLYPASESNDDSL